MEGESACLSLLLSNKHLELEVGDEVAVITDNELPLEMQQVYDGDMKLGIVPLLSALTL